MEFGVVWCSRCAEHEEVEGGVEVFSAFALLRCRHSMNPFMLAYEWTVSELSGCSASVSGVSSGLCR